MKRSVVAALVGAVMFMAAPAAQAAERAVAVRYADLDLTSVEGAQRLIKRIERAARRGCLDARHTQSEWAAYKACRREAADAAVERLAHPVVTAVYLGKRPPDVRFAAR